jgi:hypothetical protein
VATVCGRMGLDYFGLLGSCCFEVELFAEQQVSRTIQTMLHNTMTWKVPMSPESKTIDLILDVVVSDDFDADELDQLTRQLRDEIWEIDVESVDVVRDGLVPEGTKATEALTLGTLTVTILPAIIPVLIEFLRTWSMRDQNRTVKISTRAGDRSLDVEYDPKAMSPDDLKTLVETLNQMLDRDTGEKAHTEPEVEDRN